VTIDKFDPNLILVNNSKLKLYIYMEGHTLQPIIAKHNDYLLEKPLETTHFHNLFIKQPFETIHFCNMFIKEPVETNHFANLFTK
jgi:hypothetical protein